MRISDWSSDGCSSDLRSRGADQAGELVAGRSVGCGPADGIAFLEIGHDQPRPPTGNRSLSCTVGRDVCAGRTVVGRTSIGTLRSEEHTSELQSLMRISYAVFCLNKKKHNNIN